MPPTPLEKILACPNLPTLPGVAMQVLDLTRDPQISIAKIAAAVQNDPALSTKVLRTVNSSYYGLTTPCPSISRATSLLGLNTVKSIVLGFSVVDTTKGIASDDSFDLTAYWRRAVFSASGARAVALFSKSCDPEEAFLGALLQDIGMLAAFVALKEQYAKVVLGAGIDHDSLPTAEHNVLGFDHPSIGRQLAEKWRLPPQLVECIAKHHVPETCNPVHEGIVRCVAMGGTAAAALTLSDPRKKLGQFIVRGREWFNLDQPTAKNLIQQIAKGAGEIAKFLDVRTGQSPDVAAIVAEAHEQMLVTQQAIEQESIALRRSNSELSLRSVTDALTGAFNRSYFDRELKANCDQANSDRTPIGMCFIDGDHFKSVNDTHGHQAGDAVLTELARRFKETVGPAGAVCRYGGEEFTVILPGFNLQQTAALAESLRAAIERTPFNIKETGAAIDLLPVTISVGASSRDSGSTATPEELVHQADQAVYEAKKTGRNRVCTHDGATIAAFSTGTASVSSPVAATPAPAPMAPTAAPTAAPAPPLRPTPVRPPTPPAFTSLASVLVVDDDPLARKLIQVMLAKHAGMVSEFAASAEEATTKMQAWAAAGKVPRLVISDLRLPGITGIALIKWMKSVRELAPVPVVVLSGNDSATIRAGCAAVGALLFVEKSDFCTNSEKWIGHILASAKLSKAA